MEVVTWRNDKIKKLREELPRFDLWLPIVSLCTLPASRHLDLPALFLELYTLWFVHRN